MRETLIGILLLLLPSLGVRALPVETPRLTAAAQDGTGTIWALPAQNYGDSAQSGTIYYWQAGTLARQIISTAAGFRSITQSRGTNGAVYVLWQKPDPNQFPYQTKPAPCLITMHRGISSRVVARFTAAISEDAPFASPPQLYAGARGDFWIADSQPVLRHVAADGTLQTFPLKPEQFFGGHLPHGPGAQPLNSCTDSLGRRWFWQNTLASWVWGTLRGVLIWDGKTLAYHATLPGLPDCPLSVVVPQDAQHFWVAEAQNTFSWQPQSAGGVYQVNTKTLAAVPVTPPAKGAFLSVVRIFRVQGDWCMLEGLFTGPAQIKLWRRQGTAWSQVSPLLAGTQFGSQGFGNSQDTMPHAVLDTAQGTWLATSGPGLLWIPKNGKPAALIDWRYGLIVGRVSELFQVPDGRIMTFGEVSPNLVLMPPLPGPAFPARLGVSIGTPGQPVGMNDMLADQRRHLWGIRYRSEENWVLEEWDGKQWHDHSLPPLRTIGAQLYASDTRGRIWLTASVWNPPAQPQPVDEESVYDPTHETWTQYKTLSEALQAAAQPGMAFVPYRKSNPNPTAIFSSDGRVAYTESQTVSLYDGKLWRHWKNRDIVPSYPYSSASENLRFSQNGNLEVDLGSDTWEWTAETGWQSEGPIPPAKEAFPLPRGGPSGAGIRPILDNLRPILDNQGGGWVADGKSLYLTRYGLWRKQSVLSGPGSPFFAARLLQDVLQDPEGRIFFQTYYGGVPEYVVWSPPSSMPPAAPQLQVIPLSPASVRLHFGSNLAGQHWFRWRVNGGAWSAALPAASVTLTALMPGTYRVEAQTISTLLEISPAPSAAVFVLQPPTAAQIAAWVQALLSGTENAREAAIAGLVRQPETALPALQAARPRATEEGRFWIDAAIQQITDRDQESSPGVKSD